MWVSNRFLYNIQLSMINKKTQMFNLKITTNPKKFKHGCRAHELNFKIKANPKKKKNQSSTYMNTSKNFP